MAKKKSAVKAGSTRRGARRWAQADADERRRLIVDAALQLLNRHGLDAVTMRRVASQLGVGAMTLYTYVQGQHDLHHAMIQRGFEMMDENCKANSTLNQAQRWRGGARSYLSFAVGNPNLYRLMFDTPMPEGGGDLLAAGFEPLVEKVRERLREQGVKSRSLDRQALTAAGRFWIALHGLASLAIAERLDVLGCDVDALLDDLLSHVAPD